MTLSNSLFAKTLLFSASILFYTSSVSLAMEEKDNEDVKKFQCPILISSALRTIEKKQKERFPRYFRGEEKLDREAIENYRESQHKFTGKNKDLFEASHNPTLLPLLERFEQNIEIYGNNNPHHSIVAGRFLREIQFYLESESVSPCWFEYLPLRFFLCHQ